MIQRGNAVMYVVKQKWVILFLNPSNHMTVLIRNVKYQMTETDCTIRNQNVKTNVEQKLLLISLIMDTDMGIPIIITVVPIGGLNEDDNVFVEDLIDPVEAIEEVDQEAHKVDQETRKTDQKVSKTDQEVRKIDQEVRKIDQKVSKTDQKVSKTDQEVRKIDQEVRKIDQEVRKTDQEARDLEHHLL